MLAPLWCPRGHLRENYMPSFIRTGALLACALIGTSACATMTGNDFLRLAKENPQAVVFYAAGYVDAAVMLDVLKFEPPKRISALPVRICVPNGVEPQQVVDIIVQELQAHPADRQNALPTIAWFALAKAWGCPAK